MPIAGYEIPVPGDASGHSYCKAVKQTSPPHFRSVLVKPIRQIPRQGFVHGGGWGTTGEAKKYLCGLQRDPGTLAREGGSRGRREAGRALLPKRTGRALRMPSTSSQLSPSSTGGRAPWKSPWDRHGAGWGDRCGMGWGDWRGAGWGDRCGAGWGDRCGVGWGDWCGASLERGAGAGQGKALALPCDSLRAALRHPAPPNTYLQTRPHPAVNRGGREGAGESGRCEGEWVPGAALLWQQRLCSE